MNYRMLMTLGVLFSANVLAELGEPGWGGEVGILVGFGSETDNSDAVKKGSLNSKGETESSALIEPLGQIRYTFGSDNDQQVFIGSSRGDVIEGVFAFEFGYALEYGNESVVSFSYLPTIASGEVWEDPFITNTARKTTDISGDTFRVQLDNLLDVGLSGDFAVYKQDIKNDKSGAHLGVPTSVLQRDAKGYYVSLSMEAPVTETSFIEPSLSYQKHLADGEAVSFSYYSSSLTYIMMVDDHAFSVNADYSYRSFDASNPVFKKTREDNEYSATLGYENMDVLGWEDWGFNALAGYSNNNSNIEYYDSSGYFMSIGASYHF
ncbi:DUF2860 domain-containing protein [Vibrio tasmaniensis]|uniref:DUF2860 domain-containing protein n=1 Tax=Vibrio tasmaniensis TaxID=212663 RepID=UPI00111807AB|nr:DUF2860 domain-containing protein [Vibrio tasmaniensis]